MILIMRRSAVIELEERGYRLVSAANRGGEGFDTNGTQKKRLSGSWYGLSDSRCIL